MTERALDATPQRRLRVAVAASDPARHTALAAMLWRAGYEIADAVDTADVVLSDGVVPAGVAPVVTLGAANTGQAAVLPADATAPQIDAAIRAVAAGLVVRAREAPFAGFAAMPEEPAALLTPREVEVLAAIGDGLSNKEAARRLGISQHTVKFHVESVLRKLGAASRTDAVHKGLRQRLIEL